MLPTHSRFVRCLSLPSGTSTIAIAITNGQKDMPYLHLGCQQHKPERWSLHYVLKGVGTFYDANNTATEIHSGMLYKRNRQQIMSLSIDDPYQYSDCRISLDEHLYQHLQALYLWPTGQHTQPISKKRFLPHFQNLFEKAQNSSEQALLRALVSFLTWLQSETVTSTEDQLMEQAAECLAADLRADKPLRVIAQDINCGYELFRKRFRAQFHCSPGAYRIRCRIEYACALLSTKSVTETALELGYATTRAFSTQFRQHMGCSPRIWQKRL